LCSLRGLGSLEACAVIAVTIGHACLSDSLARSLARSLDCIGRTRLSANALRECRCTARGTVASANVSPIHYTCDRDRSRTYTPVSAFSSRVFPLDLVTCLFHRAENFHSPVALANLANLQTRGLDVGTFPSLFLGAIESRI